jgi:hypothetical protein
MRCDQTAVPGTHRRGGPLPAIMAGLAAVALLIGCGGAPDEPGAAPGAVPAVTTYPGTSEGARVVAAEFTRPGADPSAIVLSLRPTDDDIIAVFGGETLVDALIHYGGYWESPDVLGPAPGQTEVRIFAATSEELIAGTGDAREFPGGWALIAPHLTPGLTIYLMVFSRPGESFGVRVDGLTHVNGRWRIFPEPWEVLAVGEPGHQH